MRAFGMLLVLASCAGSPAPMLPPAALPPGLTAARLGHDDDRVVALAAGCLLGSAWSEPLGEGPGRDRCTELRLRTIDDPGTAVLVGAIGRANDIDGTVALMDHVDTRLRVIGFLSAIARTANTSDLPRAKRAELFPLFGLDPPESATELLARIELAAEAAGHPVAPDGRTLEQRERAGWKGARAGLADRLREAAERVQGPEVKRVALVTAARLDAELHAPDVRAPPMATNGHDLVIGAASCWLGRTWGEGASQRCEALAHAVYADPERAYEMSDALRAAEPLVLGDLAVRAGAYGPMARAIGMAAADPRRIPALVDMRGEAGAIGWMLALDRLEVARSRPLREEAALASMIFRVSPQNSWLDTFEGIATAVGHPLPPPELVKDEDGPGHIAIRRMARASVGLGIADRLRPMESKPGALGAAIRDVVSRIDAEYRSARWEFTR